VTKTKYCPKCQTSKPVSEFHKASGRADGLQAYCKQCRSDSKRSAEKFTTYTRVRNGKVQVVTRRVDGHGISKKTPLYKVWIGMRSRCHNPKAQNYKFYGAKGVVVCEEWRQDFLTFYEWSIAHGYADGLELDRIHAEVGYEPGNCRWVTKKANIRNRDRIWDDEIDGRLVAYAASLGKSPYEVIKVAVEEYLERLPS
jgi:hypothetical protein